MISLIEDTKKDPQIFFLSSKQNNIQQKQTQRNLCGTMYVADLTASFLYFPYLVSLASLTISIETFPDKFLVQENPLIQLLETKSRSLQSQEANSEEENMELDHSLAEWQ